MALSRHPTNGIDGFQPSLAHSIISGKTIKKE
jgi:hypothetical protein